MSACSIGRFTAWNNHIPVNGFVLKTTQGDDWKQNYYNTAGSFD